MGIPVTGKMTPTQELVLDCYRSPHLLHSLSDHSIPLPEGIGRLIQVALGNEPLDVDPADPTSVDELRRATLLYVKRVVLADGGDYYRSLGVRADASAEQIDSNYRGLLSLLQADQDASTSALCDNVLRVSKAYSIVGDAVRRRMYDRSRLNLFGVDDFDIPVDAVVDEVLSTSRRPMEPIDSVAHVERDWNRSPPRTAPPQSHTPTPTSSPAEPEPVVSEDVVAKTARNWPVPDRLFLGISMIAVGIIAFVTPILIARYSLLAPHWDRMTDAEHVPSLPTNRLIDKTSTTVTIPDSAELLAIDGQADTSTVAVDGRGDETEMVFSSQPFQLEEDVVASAETGTAPAHETAAAAANETKHDAPSGPVVVAAPVIVAPSAPSTAVRSAAKAAPVALPPPVPVETPPVAVAAPPHSVSTPVAESESDIAEKVDTSAQTDEPSDVAVNVFPAELIMPRKDLVRLVERLEATYQDGDISEFSDLFAVDARTNDRVDKIGIEEDYDQLFKSTESRLFTLKNVNWRYEGEGAVGTGDFIVRIKPRWKNRDEVFSGTMELRVERESGRLVISEMYHNYK